MLFHTAEIRLCLLLFVTTISPVVVVAYRASFPMVRFQTPGSSHRIPQMVLFKAAQPYISDRYKPHQKQAGISSLKSCVKRYSIGHRLSRGNDADAFKAYDMKKANVAVVIKVFFTRQAFDQEALSFYVLKAALPGPGAAAVAQESPWKNFVRLLDRCHYNGKPALVIEYLDQVLTHTIMLEPLTKSKSGAEASQNLGSTSSASAASPTQSIISNPARNFKFYTYRLLTALDVLHSVGIAHLDVKPSNIGVTLNGNVKLFDFQTLSTRNPRGYVGTIEYSAPEMNLGVVVPHGDKMDVWSVGCTIYEIFAGKPLFHGIRNFGSINYVYSSEASPNMNCMFKAAYFYVLWSSGKTWFDRYEYQHADAIQACPHIFDEASKDALRAESPRIFASAYPHESPSKLTAEIQHQINQISHADNTRLQPSRTKANDLLELLGGMLEFDDAVRISVRSALRHNPMFLWYRHAEELD